MIKFLICLSILAIALIFFNRSKKKTDESIYRKNKNWFTEKSESW